MLADLLHFLSTIYMWKLNAELLSLSLSLSLFHCVTADYCEQTHRQ